MPKRRGFALLLGRAELLAKRGSAGLNKAKFLLHAVVVVGGR